LQEQFYFFSAISKSGKPGSAGEHYSMDFGMAESRLVKCENSDEISHATVKCQPYDAA